MSTDCPVCQSSREKVFEGVLLRKHRIGYWFCRDCGLLQTEEPYWLEEAYTDAIANEDTGLVARNQSIARRLATLLYISMDRRGRYLDVAGGYGLLVRLMRDVGFDFYWHDDYADNMFARGFEADRVEGTVTAVTAFEVLEHVTDPLKFISENLEKHNCRTFILSTELFSGEPPAQSDWWYYTPDTGQHISFCRHSTLQRIADKLSLTLYSSGRFHMLTDRKINPRLFRLSMGMASWPGYVLAALRMQSLTFPDHEQVCRLNNPTDRA